MRKTLFLFVIFATILAYAQKPQQFSYPSKTPSGFDAERLKRVDRALQDLVDKGHIPQIVTYVAWKGQVVHNKAYGWSDIENNVPCKKSDIFRMASQTKAIAAVAVMTLFEEGLFSLDDPISKYLPEFSNMQILEAYNDADTTWIGKPAKKQILIRHLFSHTSGISYQGNFWKLMNKNKVGALNSLEPITLKDAVSRIAQLPLACEPGEKFIYSMNIEVLGRLAEVLTGKTIDKILQERIFEPLGMKETWFYLPKEHENRLVKLYSYPKGGPLRLSTHPIYPIYPIAGAKTLFNTGAGLSGCIDDYAKFCQMILNDGEFNGKRIIGRKTLELMQQNAVGEMRNGVGFGLAWDVFRPQDHHTTIISNGSMRWGGMFGTDYVIDPQEDLILLIYTNMDGNFSGSNHKTLFHNLIYQALK